MGAVVWSVWPGRSRRRERAACRRRRRRRRTRASRAPFVAAAPVQKQLRRAAGRIGRKGPPKKTVPVRSGGAALAAVVAAPVSTCACSLSFAGPTSRLVAEPLPYPASGPPEVFGRFEPVEAVISDVGRAEPDPVSRRALEEADLLGAPVTVYVREARSVVRGAGVVRVLHFYAAPDRRAPRRSPPTTSRDDVREEPAMSAAPDAPPTAGRPCENEGYAAFAEGKYARVCERCRPRRTGRPRRYVPNDFIDAEIRRIYTERAGRRPIPGVAEFGRRIGRPDWMVKKRARARGVVGRCSGSFPTGLRPMPGTPIHARPIHAHARAQRLHGVSAGGRSSTSPCLNRRAILLTFEKSSIGFPSSAMKLAS